MPDTDTVLDKLRSATWESDLTALVQIESVLSDIDTSVMSASVLYLLRRIDSYEHALLHIAEDSERHKPAACVDCQRLAASVLGMS